MSTLTVGAGQQYATIAAAVAATHDGDTVNVLAGTYTNDFLTINHKITLQAVGGMVKMVATVPPPNSKGIITVNTDLTLDHFELSGAKISAALGNNGAGIRYQGGNLTISNSYIHDNQDGLLANPVANGKITISHSEFSHNGAGDGRSHNIYVGHIASLTIDQSYIHDAVIGHEVKSRADNTTITNSRITEGPNGTGSYLIDLPNAGHGVISNNVLEKGPKAQNPVLVSFGEEGAYNGTNGASPSLTVSHNTVLDDLTARTATFVKNVSTAVASISDTTVFNNAAIGTHGLTATNLTSGPAAVTGTVFAKTAEPALDTSHPWATVTPPGGHPSNTKLVGTSLNNTLDAAGGHDVLTGGGGADIFRFGATNAGTNIITDFKLSEHDQLDLTAMFHATGLNLAGLQSHGYLSLVQAGTTAQIWVDPTGGGHYTNLAVLDGVKIADLGSSAVLI